jgi:hypothetical protein
MYLDVLLLMRLVYRIKLGTGAEGENAETIAGARLKPC